MQREKTRCSEYILTRVTITWVMRWHQQCSPVTGQGEKIHAIGLLESLAVYGIFSGLELSIIVYFYRFSFIHEGVNQNGPFL